jgi:hypothetical protein
MNKKEIQAQVTDLLSSGIPKSEVFTKLAGKGVKDSQLAHFIASYADPFRCDAHDGKINILITIMFIQALLAALLGFGIGAKIGPNAKWITHTFCFRLFSYPDRLMDLLHPRLHRLLVSS